MIQPAGKSADNFINTATRDNTILSVMKRFEDKELAERFDQGCPCKARQELKP